ncbi:MAG TPA: tRNA pseudouridine(38-40) synthase TruA [Lutibacter sp.]|nr:tRNA pseudouridine(38-40) synthase TruA [Lutibacter sp.]
MRYFIEISYKGTDFHGWQIQPNAISIQETIQKGLQTLLGEKIDIVGAGRTDTGVHARQIFAHFDTTKNINEKDFAYRLNAIIPISIFIKKIVKVTDKAHARFDAQSRSYEYHIHLVNNPFTTETTWQIPRRSFDVELMNKAALLLLKYTDFKAFSKSKTDVKTYECTVSKAVWLQNENKLIFHITANRFLRNMVRAIVGSLLEVGSGKTNLEDFEKIIINKDRSLAGVSVPAKGLFLTEVIYPNSIF